MNNPAVVRIPVEAAGVDIQKFLALAGINF
jgi:predicted metal-binding protein